MSTWKMTRATDRDGRRSSLGWFRPRPGAWISLDAELVALGILHDDPVLPGFPLGPGRQVPRLLLGGPQIQESADLAVDLRLPVGPEGAGQPRGRPTLGSGGLRAKGVGPASPVQGGTRGVLGRHAGSRGQRVLRPMKSTRPDVAE